MRDQAKTTKLTLTLLATWTAVTMIACARSADMNSQISGASSDTSIVNGQAVSSGSLESLSTVALYYPTGKGGGSLANFCTGTLIAPDVVMTAGHCFADFGQEIKASADELRNNVTVGFGLKVAKKDTDKSVVFRKIASFQVNPRYVIGSVSEATKKPMYDVTLIKLTQVAPSGAKPVELVTDESVLRSGLTVTLVGFGLLSAQPQKLATKMMQVNVQVDDPQVTATQFTYKVVGGRSSCSGDSGGPAYVTLSNGKLGVLGITSWGDQTCQQVGAYTSVPAMAPWIQETLPTL